MEISIDNTLKASLTMESFYFTECSVKRSEEISKSKLKLSISKKITPLGEHRHSVEMFLTLADDDGMIDITVNGKAVFKYITGAKSNEDAIIERNTIAILYPYFRSQVTLLTSQPNMTPVVLPVIDVLAIK